MTERQDEALELSNPRLLAAIYFSLLAVIANLFIDNLLYWMDVQYILPTHIALMLAVVIAAVFGALFGERIIHSRKPYKAKAFWWAFLMVLVALPFHTFGFLLFFKDYHAQLAYDATWLSWFKAYFLVLSYSFILFGIWLAIMAGLAAIYLRHILVYYLLRTLSVRRRQPKEGTVVKPGTLRHGETTATLPDEEKEKGDDKQS